MSDEYLWDRSGPVDSEVERLEEVLSPLRVSDVVPELALPARRSPRRYAALALAAVVLAAGLLFIVWPSEPGTPSALAVRTVSGSPEIDGVAIGSSADLAPGRWLSTGAGSARIDLGVYGELEVAPDSRLRVVELTPERRRLEMPEGTLVARVDAPPRLFVVDTPRAQAVDLGCAYWLDVGEDGAGELEVTEGRVALESGERDVVVVAGTRATIDAERGPSTPLQPSASEALRAAVGTLDERGDGSAEALALVLREAGREDAITLYNLLALTDGDDRSAVHTRLVALVPSEVPAQAVLDLERAAMSQLLEDVDPRSRWRRIK